MTLTDVEAFDEHAAADIIGREVAVYFIECALLREFLAPHVRLVERPEDADFILATNCWSDVAGAVARQSEARRAGKPLVWWTTEDPNHFETFLPQAREADFVFTTDDACVERYRALLGHDRAYWLPWACAPEIHRPLPLQEDARAFVLSANWYEFEARRWAVSVLVDPLVERGYGISLYCLPGWMWPARYAHYWRGEDARLLSYMSSVEQYTTGRVALGLNNQRSGMDGLGKTYMTSMRTFEVLGCGKPFLASHSDAYERLGFVHGEHMVWVSDPAETLHWAERLLGEDGARIARAGREFVLAHHTYAHRLRRIVDVVLV
jgi:spore maturation protein CgeB